LLDIELGLHSNTLLNLNVIVSITERDIRS